MLLEELLKNGVDTISSGAPSPAKIGADTGFKTTWVFHKTGADTGYLDDTIPWHGTCGPNNTYFQKSYFPPYTKFTRSNGGHVCH
jgi:hypothetical protein